MALIRKIGVIGQGHVGAHVANSLLMQGVADELYLADINAQKLESECQDLTDSMSFYPHNCRVVNCGEKYELLAGCDVVVNAAGDVAKAAGDRDGELFVTAEITRTWPRRLVDAGFGGVIVTISNPCDVVATEIWHLTGYDPRRIIGSGTALDSARLKNAIARRVNLDQRSICAYMLGEHGTSQFAAWSAVNFGGKPLAELAAEQPDRFGFNLAQVEKDARFGGYVTYAGKGCTEYAIANAAVRLVRAVVSDEHLVTACSTLLAGEYGEFGHYTSLPCVVGAAGVEEVVTLSLTEAEQAQLHASCEHIKGNIARLTWWDEERHPSLR